MEDQATVIRLLTEILIEVTKMADLRNIILADEEEMRVLVNALREADGVILSLRRRVAELESELQARSNDTQTQAEVDRLTLRMQERTLALEDWLVRTVRAQQGETAQEVQTAADFGVITPEKWERKA